MQGILSFSECFQRNYVNEMGSAFPATAGPLGESWSSDNVRSRGAVIRSTKATGQTVPAQPDPFCTTNGRSFTRQSNESSQFGATAADKASEPVAASTSNVYDLFNATSRPATASASDSSQAVAADHKVRSSRSASRHAGFTALNDPFVTTRSSTADSSSSVVQSSSDVGRLPPIESHAADNPSENSKRRTRKSKSKRESNAFSATDASSAASDSQLIDRGPSDDTLDVPVVDSRQKSGSPMNDSAENSANGRPSINDPLFVYSGDGKVHGSGGQSMLRGNQLPSIQKDAVDALNDPQDGRAKGRRKKSRRQSNSQFANDSDAPEPRVRGSHDASGTEDLKQEPASSSGQSDPYKSSENPAAGSNNVLDMFLAKKTS